MLDVRELTVEFDTMQGTLRAADHVSFSVSEGEVLGIVGESGSGKSVSVQSILRLLPSPPARIVAGEVHYGGRDLLQLPNHELRKVRGNEIALVSQDPIPALNPVLTVGRQIAEAIWAHHPDVSKREASARAVELLRSVQVPNSEVRVREYPHQFSGGMAQRVVIAMAIANNPRLLIADEPTTALDVTVQAQVMRTLRNAQQATGAAMILITHDLALIAEFAHRLVVMYGGRAVESGPVKDVFRDPRHPYTRALLASIPRLDVRTQRLTAVGGAPPQLNNLPTGCAFHPRCTLMHGLEKCRGGSPDLRPVEVGRSSACHFAEELSLASAMPRQESKGVPSDA